MNRELRKRLNSAIVLLLLVCAVAIIFTVLPDYWHYYILSLFTVAMVVALGFEWTRLIPTSHDTLHFLAWRWLVPLGAAAIVVAFTIIHALMLWQIMMYANVVLLACSMFHVSKSFLRRQRMLPSSLDGNELEPLNKRQWDIAVQGIIYNGLAGVGLLGFWLLSHDFSLIAFLIACVIIADSSAYFAGKRWGNKKMCPSISPGKTWTGFIAGFVSIFVFALITGSFIETRYLSVDLAHTILLGLVALLSVWGDLFISLMKRRSGVKDMSNLIPGHGGLFDRLDGMVMVFAFLSPVALYFLQAA